MPTIKQKVDMTAHELITYGIQNNIKNIILEAINEKYKEKAIIHFNENAMPIVSRDVNIHHVFEVKVEEPITEDTVFDKLISRYVFLSSKPSYAHSINTSIKEVIEDRKVATHIYLENEDNELQLIWTKEKGLIE
ncbi:hypothetical protein [Mammaliicoccus sciuri]|uniref:hypothetical protein n=1 Tax=Mammaliicoccus sciuri TaxID=1296 RepID=UPI0018C9C47E|nr:hypothetical protein [Mammaliicoccus sciuri]MBG9209430.1 hypothetical protein [Mammaliicoccus sciuri]